MQALQLPALFIFQADEKNKRRRVSQHSLRQTLFKGISQKCISKRYVKAIYSKRYSEFQSSPCALGLISYSGFSVVPAAPGFADFFS